MAARHDRPAERWPRQRHPTAETVAGFIAAADAAPEELSTIANVMPAPPMPFLPEEVTGQVVILGMLAYGGDIEAGERAIAPFRALATPLADMVKPSGYPEMFPRDDPDYHPTAVGHTMFMDHVDIEVAARIIEHLQASDASLRVAQLRVLGGAMARVPADATAFAHRSSRIMVNLAAFYDGPEDRPAREAWVSDSAAALDQGDDGAYVNFLYEEPRRTSGPHTRARPGTGSPRSSAFTTPRICSGSTRTSRRRRHDPAARDGCRRDVRPSSTSCIRRAPTSPRTAATSARF